MDADKNDGDTGEADLPDAQGFEAAPGAMVLQEGVPGLMRELEALAVGALDAGTGTDDRVDSVTGIVDWARRRPFGLDLGPLLIQILEQICPQMQCPQLWEHLADARLASVGVFVLRLDILRGLPTLGWIDSVTPDMGQDASQAPRESRACEAWFQAWDWASSRSDEQLEQLHVQDSLSIIRILKLLMLYGCDVEPMNTLQGRLCYLEDHGFAVWDALLPRLERCWPSREAYDRELGAPAQLNLRNTLREYCAKAAKAEAAALATPEEKTYFEPRSASETPMHVVVRSPIPPASHSEDKETLKRYSTLREPLPVVGLPRIQDLDRIIKSLGREFPWATDAIEEIGRDLRARKLFGGIEMGMAPMLVVGPPGCGKSRLGRRIAEEFAVPFQLLGLGGSHDVKLITGTARGWGGGQPAPLLTLMAQRESASAFVVLDEVDKAVSYGNESKPVISTLLGLLEPENARRWHDGFLQAECDLSKVMFWATANLLSPIAKPLLSRLRVVYMPEPRQEHFGAIAEGIAGDIAAEWGLHRDVLPQVGHLIALAGARNVREVRAIVKRGLQDFAEANLRRERLH